MGNGTSAMIEPETERVWLNLSQAIMNRDVICLDSSKDLKMETVRKLGQMIAQEVEQVNIGEQMNFKVLERFFNGSIYTGQWIVFNEPKTQEMFSLLATHIINIKKILQDTNFEKTKTFQSQSFNSAFFISMN